VRSIDLHGVKHQDVPDILIECCATYETPFIVITGDSPEMKKIVSRVAIRFNLEVRDTINNPGRVILSENR
jgi:hypothetical protein